MSKDSSQEGERPQADAGCALLDAAESARLVARLADGGGKERALGARLAIERAILEVVGERGWTKTTVEEVVERSGSNRARFYSSFGDKTNCYATAYEGAIEALAARLLRACAEASGWAAGMHGALVALARFIDGETTVARGLLLEASAAGAAVAVKHDEVFGRLSRAIDRARRETVESRHPVPPFTSRFILSAIHTAVLKFLAEHEARSFEPEVPGLLYLAVDYYFGPAAARAQVRRLCGEGGR